MGTQFPDFASQELDYMVGVCQECDETPYPGLSRGHGIEAVGGRVSYYAIWVSFRQVYGMGLVQVTSWTCSASSPPKRRRPWSL